MGNKVKPGNLFNVALSNDTQFHLLSAITSYVRQIDLDTDEEFDVAIELLNLGKTLNGVIESRREW